MKQISYIVLFIVFTETCNNLEMSKCVLQILNNHYSPREVIVLSQSNSTSVQRHIKLLSDETDDSAEMTDYLYREGEWLFLISGIYKDPKIKRTSSSRIGGYILTSMFDEELNASRDIDDQLLKLKSSVEWAPRAKFIITVPEIHCATEQLLQRIFEVLWKWGVINSVLVSPTCGDGSEMLDIVTYFPYDRENQCGTLFNTVLLDQWMMDAAIGFQKFVYNSLLFPKKLPRNLQGCPLLVSLFEIGPMVLKNENGDFEEGIEIQMLKEMTRRKNMSIVIREQVDGSYWGVSLGNGSWNGVTGEVMDRRSDIALDNWFFRCDVIDSLECTLPHLVDNIRWFVPCAKQHPRWTSLTRVFKSSLWLGLFISYLVASLVMSILVKTVATENQSYTGVVKCLLNFWAVMVEESASNNPPSMAAIRIVFLAWVICCWAINTVYQAYLTTFLVDPGFQQQLVSEDEILSSGIPYLIPSTLVAVIPELSSERYKHHARCDSYMVCQDRLAFRGDVSLFFSKYLIEYATASRYMDGRGKALICDFEEIFSNQLVSIPVKKGFMLYDEFNDMTLRIRGGGFLDLWWDNIKYTSTLKAAKDFEIRSGEYVKLSLDHLQSGFYVLIIGYALSVLVFYL